MSKSARPIRIGKLRSGGQRPWQVKLYGPTSGRSHPRVFFRDPTTGAWRNLVAKDLDDANRIFNETEEWLDAASGVQTSDTELVPANLRDMTALAARLLRRTRDDGVRRRTFEKYESVLRCHILPVIGTTLVSDWDEEHCRDILRRSRNAGLAPDTVQDHGAVLVALVKEAHRRPRWLARDTDPMEGVRYRARARHQGQASFFIPPSHRPETAAVHALCIELWHRGRHQGRPWYCAMGQIAGFLGLRWSEIIALRPIDYDSDRRVIIVSSSIEQSRAGFHREDTKSGKIREVPVTGAVHRWLVRRSRAVLSLACD